MMKKNDLSSVCGEPQNRELTRHFERGEIIFQEKAPAKAAYNIQSGRVKLYYSNGTGERHVVGLLGVGDIAGLYQMLANEAHTLTAEAIEPTDICVVPRELALGRYELTAERASQLMASLSADFLISQEQTVSVLRNSVSRRTANLLLSLCDDVTEGEPSGPRLLTGLPRREMAQILETTPESISRTIHAFVQQGLIKATRTEIVLLDFDGLQKIAHTS